MQHRTLKHRPPWSPFSGHLPGIGVYCCQLGALTINDAVSCTQHLMPITTAGSAMLSIKRLLQIVSGSRDKTIKLWNTLGECKYTIGEPDGHTEWVSCVRFSPVTTNPIIVSAGWDKLVKVMLLPFQPHIRNALPQGQNSRSETNTTGVAYQGAQANVHRALEQ